MAEHIVINDVGPRDGLQNQAKLLNVDERLQLIRALVDANVTNIEAGAFVSPKAVPAMAGCAEIIQGLAAMPMAAKDNATELSVLIPNIKGYELALNAGVKTVAMVLYASEGMAIKNVGMTRQEADLAAVEIIRRAKTDNISVIATVSVAFECPFDGPTDPAIVCAAASKFLELGVSSVVIADTIGAANPMQVSELMRALVAENDALGLACHFHDTRALGLANVYAAVEAGIRRFDASIAGLGGCPFAPGASGNIATEDAVMMLHSMGFDTGIDLPKLLDASDLAEQLTGISCGGRSKPWLKPHLMKNAVA
ncbi:MAG: hydroxymethylglutaryl-CoA lyase [Pseudomonadales bacterium]